MVVHGRMEGEEKHLALERFRRGDSRLLVGTTVLEVGIHEPEATVMVVEDEVGIRELVVQALDGWGYRVLAAGDPPEARRLAVTHDGGIDLLLTDMIMPNGRGDALAAELSASRPDLKVIIMSGYTDAAVQFHGADMEGLAFLQKPFTLRELNRRLGEMLGG